jgi:lactoylglutathione lyase
MQVNYAIVFVSDMLRAVSFYRDVVGLPLRFESSHWTEFSTEGATLALHLSALSPAGESAGRDLPPGRCRPGLGVADLDAFHRRMLEHDVACVQEPKDVFGSRIAQYVDPDGLTFSVSERR